MRDADTCIVDLACLNTSTGIQACTYNSQTPPGIDAGVVVAHNGCHPVLFHSSLMREFPLTNDLSIVSPILENSFYSPFLKISFHFKTEASHIKTRLWPIGWIVSIQIFRLSPRRLTQYSLSSLIDEGYRFSWIILKIQSIGHELWHVRPHFWIENIGKGRYIGLVKLLRILGNEK